MYTTEETLSKAAKTDQKNAKNLKKSLKIERKIDDKITKKMKKLNKKLRKSIKYIKFIKNDDKMVKNINEKKMLNIEGRMLKKFKKIIENQVKN